MNTSVDNAINEKSFCCCMCKGMGVCYLVCLVSPVVLFAGVVGVAIVSFLS